MSALFEVHVIEKKNATIRLDVFIIHPDQFEFYKSKNFALQLLWSSVHPAFQIDCPLARAISMKEILTPEWTTSHEMEFIHSVKILSKKNIRKYRNNLPPLDWNNLSIVPQAEYEIVVTDPKWIEHLVQGQIWKTAAYDHYDDL